MACAAAAAAAARLEAVGGGRGGGGGTHAPPHDLSLLHQPACMQGRQARIPLEPRATAQALAAHPIQRKDGCRNAGSHTWNGSLRYRCQSQTPRTLRQKGTGQVSDSRSAAAPCRQQGSTAAYPCRPQEKMCWSPAAAVSEGYGGQPARAGASMGDLGRDRRQAPGAGRRRWRRHLALLHRAPTAAGLTCPAVCCVAAHGPCSGSAARAQTAACSTAANSSKAACNRPRDAMVVLGSLQKHDLATWGVGDLAEEGTACGPPLLPERPSGPIGSEHKGGIIARDAHTTLSQRHVGNPCGSAPWH